MKNALVALALVFSTIMVAQDVKPTFEKQGDLTKGTFFHDNGKIRQQGFYKNGKLHGKWKSYDLTGKKVAAVLEGELRPEGKHTVYYNGAGLLAGQYLLVLQGEEIMVRRKMAVVR